jgi:hypothetical protein
MSDARPDVETLIAALSEARASAEDGAEIELSGLEAAVDAALRQARTAPSGERVALQKSLVLLVAELERLAAAISRQHHAAAQARATAAYGEANKASGDR